MTRDRIYDAWRPPESPWSRWVKPVLFSFLRDTDLTTAALSTPDWQVPLAPDTAIVVDLPGADGVMVGLALSRRGYVPIPVYNASPFITSITDPPWPAAFSVVDMIPLMKALCAAAEVLAAAQFSPSAPPVFLIDSNRRGRTNTPEVGWFDNRSFIASVDFPSADFFKQHGVSKIVLIQEESKIQADLLEVLLVWQGNGMEIARQAPWEQWSPRLIAVEKLPALLVMWRQLRRSFGYRRDYDGTFGKLVPPSSS